jgi:hypothetical protein
MLIVAMSILIDLVLDMEKMLPHCSSTIEEEHQHKLAALPK